MMSAPSWPSRVHLVGICGTGMGSLAGLFRAAGAEVRGSDTGIYPPMSRQLAGLGVPIFEGYDPAHLDWGPTLVVVGNIARADNPEAVEASRRGLACRSMAAAVAEYFLEGRHPVVVAGTHGKTTSAALLAWTLHAAGRDPGFLVGGVLRNFEATFRLGSGPLFVIEGDEYETAFFDRSPKFLHYRPRTSLLTSVEFDHAEVFRDLDAVLEAFRSFVSLIPADGRLVACGDDPNVVRTSLSSRAPVTLYGLGEAAVVGGRTLEAGPRGTRFEVRRKGRQFGAFLSPLTGDQNLRNLTGVVEVLAGLGLAADEIASGLASFAGVRRRQEIRGVAGGVTVVDDFAHHPTAVRETLHGLRLQFPGQRLVAVFEPRTNSTRRAVFQDAYAASFADADRVVIAAVDHPERAPEGDRFDPLRLVADLERAGLDATYIAEVDDIVQEMSRACRSGDVVVVMSNGSFGGMPGRLLAAFETRARRSGAASHLPPGGAPPV